jgi:heme/copper-type cytochrome/quinol oxidase subunit 3
VEDDIKVFGFWVYLMTDLVIFATLFATFIVLRNNTYNGPSGHQIFEVKTVVQETLILLTSSFTCSLGTLCIYRARLGLEDLEGHQSDPSSNDRSSTILMQYGSPRDRPNLDHSETLQNLQNLTARGIIREKKYWAVFWFFITALLGISFLYLEIVEFSKFYHQGDSWHRSGFLSAFFTLVGTHGLHISCGLLWMIVMMFHLLMRPLIAHVSSQVYRMAFFWHFLDLVWIFIFTIVYGMGILL